MGRVNGLAVLLLIAAIACGKSGGGKDASGGSGGASGGSGGSMDATAGSGGGGSGGTGGQSCPGEGMACSASGTCCPPFVCAGGICFPPPSQDAGCPGSAGFGCIFGGCRGDTGSAAVCMNGTWGCPTGATDSRTCGGCTGNPPPDYVCGDGGWIRADASAD